MQCRFNCTVIQKVIHLSSRLYSVCSEGCISLEMPRSKQRQRRNRNRKQGGGEKKGNTWDQDFGVRGNYALTVRHNDDFVKYYKNQELMPPEEWDCFMQSLAEPLPSTFRITGSKSQASEMLKCIKGSYLNDLLDVNIEGKTIEPPQCLSWYPEEVAWQINLDRRLIRHSEPLKKFHRFLIQETESGNISRQEAVSMIPPLVLDVQPHHKVLDMCAAPGSKTAQLIEMLHADEKQVVPEGFVVANDADNKRCYLMVHQVRRLQSPSFIVINHDASALPSFKVKSPTGDKEISMHFDRVLCDVPCSGDGTLRKNYDAWKRWNPAAGHSLHNLQSRILSRGLELLAVGGRLVYSTCSFNPVENEAVICRMLQKTNGAVQLVDASSSLPGLKYEKGLTKWKVMTREGEFLTSVDEVPEKLKNQIRPSVFPPNPEEAESLNLNRCMRVLPHKQNTGGFFIAVLEKTKEVPWVTFKSWGDTEEKAVDDGQGDGNGETAGDGEAGDNKAAAEAEENPEGLGEKDTNGDGTEPGDKRKDAPSSPPHSKKRRRMQIRGYKEDPFVFLKEDEAVWPGIRDFYDISPEFPVTQLLVRCTEGKRRNLYFASKAIRELVQLNEDRFKFINMGLKLLNRSESRYVACDFRIAQDGLSALFPYLRKRVVSVTKEDLIVILSQENPYLVKLTDGAREAMEKIEQGGLVYVYEPDGRPDSPACRIVICGWLGKVSCRSFLPKNERGHYLRLCGEELKTKEEIKAEKEAKKQDGGAEEGSADSATSEDEVGADMGGTEEDGAGDKMDVQAESLAVESRTVDVGGDEAGAEPEKESESKESS